MIKLCFNKNGETRLDSCEQWWINFVNYHTSIAISWYGFDSINEILQEYNAIAYKENCSIIFENDAQASFFILRWS
jgi:hypothetical protein